MTPPQPPRHYIVNFSERSDRTAAVQIAVCCGECESGDGMCPRTLLSDHGMCVFLHGEDSKCNDPRGLRESIFEWPNSAEGSAEPLPPRWIGGVGVQVMLVL